MCARVQRRQSDTLSGWQTHKAPVVTQRLGAGDDREEAAQAAAGLLWHGPHQPKGRDQGSGAFPAATFVPAEPCSGCSMYCSMQRSKRALHLSQLPAVLYAISNSCSRQLDSCRAAHHCSQGLCLGVLVVCGSNFAAVACRWSCPCSAPLLLGEQGGQVSQQGGPRPWRTHARGVSGPCRGWQTASAQWQGHCDWGWACRPGCSLPPQGEHKKHEK